MARNTSSRVWNVRLQKRQYSRLSAAAAQIGVEFFGEDEERNFPSMRNHPDKASVAQYLDGTRLTGRLQIPVLRYLRRRRLERKTQRNFDVTGCYWAPPAFDPYEFGGGGADPAAETPCLSTDSEIELGSGLVFSNSPISGRITKKKAK